MTLYKTKDFLSEDFTNSNLKYNHRDGNSPHHRTKDSEGGTLAYFDRLYKNSYFFVFGNFLRLKKQISSAFGL